MNIVSKLAKWLSITIIFFSSLWVINLSYLAHAFIEGSKEKIFNGDIKVSLATEALSHNWYVLIFVAALYFLIAIYLIWKVKKHLVLYVMVALSSFITASIFNVLVVSAGFELS